MHIRLLGTTLLLIQSYITFAIDSPFEINDTINGKPMGLIYKVYNGKEAIWLGGENGFYSISGQHSKHIILPKSNSLGDVWDIVEDSFGNIWLATEGAGVFRYQPKEEVISVVEQSNGLDSLNCNKLALSNKGNILAGCGGNVYEIAADNLKVERVFKKIDKEIEFTDISVLKDGRVMILSLSNGLFVYDHNGALQRRIEFQKNNFRDQYRELYVDEMDFYWIGGEKSVIRLSSKFGEQKNFLFDRIQSNSRWVRSIFRDFNGDVWIAADELYVIVEGENEITTPGNLFPFLTGNYISNVNSITESEHGELLLVSNIEGLVSMSTMSKSLYFLAIEKFNPSKSIHAAIKSGNQKVIFFNEQGIFEYSFQDRSSSKLMSNPTYILNVLEGLSEDLLVTIPGAWPQTLNFENKEFVPVSVGMSDFPEGGVNEVVAIGRKGNNLYFALFGKTLNGIYRGEVGLNFELIKGAVNVDEIAVSNNGSVFFATRKSGVLELLENGSWKTWLPNDFPTKFSTITNCIEEDKSGTIWLCTNGNGLGYLDRETGQIKYIDSQYTANSKYIRELVQDTEGYFWVMTNQGLVRYDHDNVHSIRLGKEDGIVDTDFEVTASINLHDDRILIAGDKLNYILDTKQANAHLNERMRRTTKALIVDLNVFEKQNRNPRNLHAGNRRSFRVDDGLILSYDDFLFTLSFAANNYVDRKILGFEYRLIGLDDNWVSVPPNSATATFSTLPHGNYELQVRVSDPKSIEAQPVTQLRVKILPPFWLTWQAYSIYLVILLMIIWGAARLRTFKLKRDNALLEKTVGNKTFELNKSKRFVAELLDQKHTLFANVSHEFRTPLSLIMAPVEVLKSSLVDKYQVHQANLISKNAKRLTLLVEQVLDLAKLENTTIKQYQKYSIEQAVNSVFDTFLPLAESKMQKLGVSCNCNGVLYLTSDSFEKIVSNIVMNAIKYTPREGTILIEAEKVDDYLLLSVTDDGPGIDLDKQEKIFERFSRIDVSEQVVGSGLGLAIASELAIFNDGKIWVKSSLGQGAKFYIRLPLAEFDLSDHDIKNVKVKKIESEYLVEETNKINYFPQDKHTKDLSVLIVEDSTDLRGFLSDALSSVFNCAAAKDGLEGFEIATKNLPDLIITDYAMPNIDGHQFTDMLRNEETTSHIPIIMLTAKGDEENRKESWRKDIDDFIPKPFELEELKLRINRLISIRERLRKRYSNDVNLVLANGTDRTAVSFANKKDQEFYQRFEEMIEENFSSEAFNRPTAANKMALSERQLNRKLGALIDHNFSEYLRKFRMQKAKQFLLEGRQITEVSFDVGFSSPSYFSSCFKTEFGLSPSEFVERGTAGVT